MKRPAPWALCATLIAAAPALAAAPAESAPQAPPAAGAVEDSERPAPAEARVLDAVTVVERANQVVTNVATRLPAEALETPYTVLSVSDALIEHSAATSLADVMRYAATVGGTDNFGNAGEFFSMRGFQLSAGNNYFRDGIRYRKYGQVPLYDIERVEILRGPASVLYGALEPGGVVNIVTKKPQATPAVSARTRVGGNDYRQVVVDATGPLGDSLRYRVQGYHQEGGSFRDKVGGRAEGFSGQLEADLGPDTLLTARASVYRDRRTGDRGTVLARDAAGRVDFADIPRARFLGEDFAEHAFDDLNLSLSLRHDLNAAWQVRADLVRSEQTEDRTYIWAMPAEQIVGTDGLLQRQIGDWDAKLQGNLGRVEAAGHFELGPTAHRVLFGAEFERFTNRRTNLRYRFSAINIYNPVYLDHRPANGAQTLNSVYASRFDSRSYYVQDLVDLGPYLTLLGGLRYDHVREEHPDTGQVRQKADGVTPQIGVVFRPTRWLSPYVSYTRSFVPQDGTDREGKAFEPQKSRQYEAGVKIDLAPARTFLTIAAYRLERRNLKVTDPVDPSFSRLSGLRRSKGVEVSLDTAPLPGLNLSLNYAYAREAKFIVDNSYAGNGIPNVPRHAVGVFADYAFQGGLAASVGLTHVGRRYGTDNNSFTLPPYTLVDLGLRYALTKQVELSVNLRNAFDQTYYTGSINSTTIGVGEPRTLYAGLKLEL